MDRNEFNDKESLELRFNDSESVVRCFGRPPGACNGDNGMISVLGNSNQDVGTRSPKKTKKSIKIVVCCLTIWEMPPDEPKGLSSGNLDLQFPVLESV